MAPLNYFIVYSDPSDEHGQMQSSQNQSADNVEPPTCSQSPVRHESNRQPPPLQKSPYLNDVLMWRHLTDDEIEREVSLIRAVLE